MVATDAGIGLSVFGVCSKLETT